MNHAVDESHIKQIVLDKHNKTPKERYIDEVGWTLVKEEGNIRIMTRDADVSSEPHYTRGTATLENCTMKEFLDVICVEDTGECLLFIVTKIDDC
jgi:hypothetical protein